MEGEGRLSLEWGVGVRGKMGRRDAGLEGQSGRGREEAAWDECDGGRREAVGEMIDRLGTGLVGPGAAWLV